MSYPPIVFVPSCGGSLMDLSKKAPVPSFMYMADSFSSVNTISKSPSPSISPSSASSDGNVVCGSSVWLSSVKLPD